MCVGLDSGLCVSKGDHSLVRRSVSTLLRSPRSENTGPRVYREMPLTNTSPNKDVTRVDMLEAITEEVPEGKAFNIYCFEEPEYVVKIMARQAIQVLPAIWFAIPIPPPGIRPQQ